MKYMQEIHTGEVQYVDVIIRFSAVYSASFFYDDNTCIAN